MEGIQSRCSVRNYTCCCQFVKIWFVDRILLGMSAITIQVDLVISLTLIIEIIFAKMVGCVFPILAKMKLDPAVISSPFITTVMDALSF